MEKILISACLLGYRVRYDARELSWQHRQIDDWFQEGRLVMVCPEVCGGLPTPRPPAEIVGGSAEDVVAGSAKVLTRSGEDVTKQYLAGAQQALELVRSNDIKVAILKENSPSCGSNFVYDGSFSGTRLSGVGVTTVVLRQAGIVVFSEDQIAAVVKHLSNS